MKTIQTVCAILLAALFAHLTSAAQTRTRVLVVTGGHGFDQNPFFRMFEANSEIHFTAAAHSKTNATVYDQPDLLDYDVVVLYDMPKEITPSQKARFMSLFDQGIGLVVLHHALVSYPHWPDYERIIGGRYLEPNPNKPGSVTEQAGCEHDVEVPVVIVATNHPVTSGLKNFTIHDEIYWGYRVGSDVEPLITTTHSRSGKPLGWARTQGRSRIVFLQPGHGKEAFNNENYRRLLSQAIRWTAKSPDQKTGSEQKPKVFMLDANYLSITRQRIAVGDTAFTPALEALRDQAEQLLDAKLVSVMDKRTTPPSGDKHDYMSQAPYFWPNPATSNGLPYIRRDGERNPEIKRISDHGNILEMPEKVQALALAFYFTGDEKYAAKAVQFLRTWFLEPTTRMNPHFQFAQGIPGINTGRGIGLIESRGLVKVVDSVGLLADSKALTESDQRGLEQWFGAFLHWMLASQYGRDEAAAKNNHGTYYDIQVASYALFLGKSDLAAEVLNEARQKRIALQIEPDGRQPLELARTRAWGYSQGNLSGLMSLARLGQCVGVDLWGFETTDGRSIRKGFDYLLPYGIGEKPWPHQQLGGGAGEGFAPLLRQAAAHYPDARLRELARRYATTLPDSRERLLHPAL